MELENMNNYFSFVDKDIFVDDYFSFTKSHRLYETWCTVYGVKPDRILMTIEQAASFIEGLKPSERNKPQKYDGVSIDIV